MLAQLETIDNAEKRRREKMGVLDSRCEEFGRFMVKEI
jgi:hypothetical protein